MEVKILGFGEIGQSIYGVYAKSGLSPAYKDLNNKKGNNRCDLLHVCIPFSDKFIDIVLEEVKSSNAKICVIHSTVEMGITSGLNGINPWVVFIHSPVIGVHPNLTKSLLTFTKWVGIYDIEKQKEQIDKVITHFMELGITTKIATCDETELFKLLDTTYYGLCLSFNAEARKLMELSNVDYNTWVSYLIEYNKGYEKIGMGNVTRPYFNVLTMPIGGHCIVPNANILEGMGVLKNVTAVILKWSK